jgi:hypothetical protein
MTIKYDNHVADDNIGSKLLKPRDLSQKRTITLQLLNNYYISLRKLKTHVWG